MDRPSFLTGALVGFMLTVPLVAVFFLAHELAGFAFVPFDVFDRLARVLPGALITTGIDAMVAAIRALHLGETSRAAKTAEQTLAVAGLIATGTVAAAVVFVVLRGLGRRAGYTVGLVTGAVIGVPAALISAGVAEPGRLPSAVNAVWIVVAFLGWGLALAASYQRLRTAGAGVLPPAMPPPEGVGAEPAPAAAAEAIERVDRRRFLVRLGGATAAITVAGAGTGILIARGRERRALLARGKPWSEDHALPNAGAEVQPVPGTRPELTPVADHYRIDINTLPPVVDERDWRLRIGGLVDRPGIWTLDELRTRYEPLHQFITLSCISNPVGGDLISTTRWTGVSVRRILEDVGPRPDATHLLIRSVDGYYEVVAIDAARADPRIMLTYAWDGLPLPADHGFPLRIYVPNVYGMKQPKWIESIEAINGWEPGYWVRRGWDEVARMKATSVIDAVESSMAIIEGGRRALVAVGGIAHAGARGISRVELRVDDGPWIEAKLRQPLSETTWVIWRYEWPFQPGDHTFTVRCWDGAGAPQIEERSPVRPSGATGLYSERMML